MANEITPPVNNESKDTACITLSKDQASSLKVGTAVRLEVAGEVKSIARCYNDTEKYDVTLENPIVKNISEDPEMPKDESKQNAATMPKEELKKAISKDETY